MNDNKQKCTCSSEGYSPECPEVFLQGGRLLHSLDSETQLKPRVFLGMERETKTEPRMFKRWSPDDILVDQGDNRLVELTPNESVTGGPVNENAKIASDLIRNHSTASEFQRGKMIDNDTDRFQDASDYHYDQVKNAFPEGLSLNPIPQRINARTKLVDADAMMEKSREMLRKYEALKIGDKELTDLSIGGYQVDLEKAAQKASMVAPLPPSKLPKIYIDSDMNFLHHFFQGLDRLLGRDKVLSVVNQDRYYTTSELILLPLIEDIVKVGYERKDTNLTVFTKTVLSSTFECDEKSGPDQDQRGLIVAANLWGFQYIECGMELKEADLRMWLSISYNHFRNMFFNTFKDSGMPAFAMEGVQARYESVPERKFDLADRTVAISGPTRRETGYYPVEYAGEDDTRSTRSARRHRHRREEPTIGNLLFGRRGR